MAMSKMIFDERLFFRTSEGCHQNAASNPSKRHRERLNVELDALASMLPFEDAIIARLDKISILRLAVCFLQAKNVFQCKYLAVPATFASTIVSTWSCCLIPPHGLDLNFENGSTILKALSGFVMILSESGDVLYASENIISYLGYHQCDVLRQSIFEIIHSEDTGELRRVLQWNSYDCFRVQQKHTTVRFRCFMDNACGFVRFEIYGRLVALDGGKELREYGRLGFLAACIPYVLPCHVELACKENFLTSKHSLKFALCSSDEILLAMLEVEESFLPVSFYMFIHEQDVALVAESHKQVLTTGGSGILVYRLRSHSCGRIYWFQTRCRLVVKIGKSESIICTHRLLTRTEDLQIFHKNSVTMDHVPYYCKKG
ncbi:unnamed protein product [Soboliphyme baturini]|uniref:Aryl hydrocarbon receptor n=1 Tax=Soboliphyme baturini TaxID=241478 RepID=A0A183IM26_9BILA|nr:unnamed protein product [Soboliphyme baturini]